MIWQRICVLIITLVLVPVFAQATSHKAHKTHHSHSTKKTHTSHKTHNKHKTTKKSSKTHSKHKTHHNGKTSKPTHKSKNANPVTAKELDSSPVTHGGHLTLSEQRTEFKLADRALKNNEMGIYTKLVKNLHDYPLYPYLLFSQLLKKGFSPDEVDDFMRRYKNSPLANDLRYIWLDHLAQTKAWNEYLKFYQTSNDNKYLCYQLQARLATDPEAKQEVFAKVRDIWLHDKSQPDACNPLFDAFEAQNGLTEELAWKRIALAAANHQRGLVTHLGKFVAKRDLPLINVWLEIDANPYKISSIDFGDYNNPFKETIMVLGIEKLSLENLARARSVFENLQEKYRLKAKTLAEINRYIGLQLAYKYDSAAIHYLKQIPADLAAEDVHSWRVRIALHQQDWNAALHWISEMPDPLRQKSVWEYWEARGLKATGEEQHALELLHNVAHERDFYGVLAANQTNSRNPYQPKSTAIPEKIQHEVANNRCIIRARELYMLNRNDDAKREWDYALRDFDDQRIKAAAQLAHDWAWYDRAIITASKSQTPVDLNIRFPLVHRGSLLQGSKQQDIDPAWAFAIVQQESLFITRARSSVGAIGLMQLMPKTAKGLAKELGHKHHDTDDLLRPDDNIKLGTAYLAKMYRMFGDNSVLATAAYNAGPSRVRQWLPHSRSVPSDIWIETIPYKETRTYVKNVMTYSTLYDLQLGRKPSLDKRLGDIRARQQTTIELEKPF